MAEGNTQYGKQSYWEDRYTTEEAYDWFPSVYAPCLDLICERIEEVLDRQIAEGSRNAFQDGTEEEFLILHLGTGNSSLVYDIYERYVKDYCTSASSLSTSPPFTLVQVAVDYSNVVIQRMQEKYKHLACTSSSNSSGSHPPFNVHWVVADIRDLSRIRQEFPSGFDLIIDKGTMDAFQADKENPNLDDDISRMLQEVSSSFRSSSAYAQFIQITWEIPPYRLFYTLGQEAGYPYTWKDKERHCLIGESDMYRFFTYEVEKSNGKEKEESEFKKKN